MLLLAVDINIRRDYVCEGGLSSCHLSSNDVSGVQRLQCSVAKLTPSKRQLFSRFEDGYEVRDYSVGELEKHMALYQDLVDRFVNMLQGGGL